MGSWRGSGAPFEQNEAPADCWGPLWGEGQRGGGREGGPKLPFRGRPAPAAAVRCRLPQVRARHGGGAGAAAASAPAAGVLAAAAGAAGGPGGGCVAAAPGPELPAQRRPLPGAGPPVPLRCGGGLGRGAGLCRAGRRLPAVLAAALRPCHR